MADPRFFTKAGPFTLTQLAEAADAKLPDGAEASRLFNDVAPLHEAGPEHVSFLANKKYVEAFEQSSAGACVTHPDDAARAPAGMALLLSENPYRSYAQIAWLFYPRPTYAVGISLVASVDPSAEIGAGSRVESGAVIGPKAKLGARCLVGPNAVIGAGVVLGEDCSVGACASISHSIIGNRVRIRPGARIGQDGFGFAMGPEGYLQMPQLGRVIIGDDVEIGANTIVDRGSGPDTLIGPESRIDSLVQIAHNVRLGSRCVIVAQVGISGSTQFGNSVVAAGQAGITGHLKIGDGARIGAQAGVMRDIEAGTTVGGSPALPMSEWLRQVATLNRLIRKKSKTEPPAA